MIINNSIIEYDIKSAGLTALYHLDLITLEEFDTYDKMDKRTRVIELGNHIKYLNQLTGKPIYRAMELTFKIYIEIFNKMNNILDHNIIEVNHDALWLAGRRAKITDIDQEYFKLDIVKNHLDHLKFEYDLQLINLTKVKFVAKREYTLLVKYKNLNIYLNSMNHSILFRGANPDPHHMFYPVILDILLSYEYNDPKLYDKLHKYLQKLEEDAVYYGNDMINNIPNINLIKYFIKEMI